MKWLSSRPKQFSVIPEVERHPTEESQVRDRSNPERDPLPNHLRMGSMEHRDRFNLHACDSALKRLMLRIQNDERQGWPEIRHIQSCTQVFRVTDVQSSRRFRRQDDSKTTALDLRHTRAASGGCYALRSRVLFCVFFFLHTEISTRCWILRKGHSGLAYVR
jgi:hypothetical protein